MRRRIAIGAAAAAVCLALPAAAAGTHSTWQNGGAGAPTSTDFEDVAAGGAIVAVGAASDGAAIYRRAGSTWVRDTVTLPAGASSARLLDVAVGSSTAWAVGTYKNATGDQPLVAKLTAGLTSAAPATWTRLQPGPDSTDLPGALSEPLSVAVRGEHVLIGDADGNVHPATGGAFRAPIAALPTAAQAINGLAVRSGGGSSSSTVVAVAATDAPDGGGPVLYEVSAAQPPMPSTMIAISGATGSQNVRSVASASTGAYAVEEGAGVEPGIWTLEGASWSRETPDVLKNKNLHLDAVDVAGTEAAVAGDQGPDTGAIWRRTGTSPWVLDHQVSGHPMKGVAVISSNDIWAVGSAGTVLHYTLAKHPPQPTPDPVPDTTITGGPSGASSDPNVTFTFSSDQAGAHFECSLDSAPFSPCGSPHSYTNVPPGGHVFTVRARTATQVDPSPARREFVISQPASPQPQETPDSRPPPRGSDTEGDRTCKAAPRQLAKKVRVKVKRKKIRIHFKLKRRAKVRAVAKRRGKVVGKTPKKIFKRGRQNVQFKVKKKPKTIRLIVKPAKTCR